MKMKSAAQLCKGKCFRKDCENPVTFAIVLDFASKITICQAFAASFCSAHAAEQMQHFADEITNGLMPHVERVIEQQANAGDEN